ncbi:hypothetical protein HMPREF1322_1449 [Porphyromonas gingivalis W50]|nr:hypothetical protein HMPREF1322_1449 [Porphyromonas gingivalis W50]
MKLPFLKTGKLARNFFRFGSINYFFHAKTKIFSNHVLLTVKRENSGT